MRSTRAAVALVLMLAAGPARAAETTVDVSAASCPYLHVEEVQRVLDIELATVASAWTGPDRLQAQLSCDDSRLGIVVVDPLTGKHLSRSVTLDWHAGDHDRTVALLVSQLFLTSWTELLLARTAATPDLPPLPHAPPAVERAAETAVRSSLRAPAVSGSITLMLGPRVRELGQPLLAEHANLRPSLLVGRHARLFFDVGYERGQAARTAGTVLFSLATASLGFGWRLPLGTTLALDGALGASASYAEMQGNPVGGAAGASASGALAEVFLEVGPSVVLGPARVGLAASAGLTAPRAVAHAAGDIDVSIGGPWLGASLVVGTSEPTR